MNIELCPMCDSSNLSLKMIDRVWFKQYVLQCNNCLFQYVNNSTGRLTMKSIEENMKRFENED